MKHAYATSPSPDFAKLGYDDIPVSVAGAASAPSASVPGLPENYEQIPLKPIFTEADLPAPAAGKYGMILVGAGAGEAFFDNLALRQLP